MEGENIEKSCDPDNEIGRKIIIKNDVRRIFPGFRKIFPLGKDQLESLERRVKESFPDIPAAMIKIDKCIPSLVIILVNEPERNCPEDLQGKRRKKIFPDSPVGNQISGEIG
jgi:hypothetical protein